LATDDRSEARRRRRLSRSGDFDRVYKQGSSSGNRFLVLYSFGRGESDRADGMRLGISVGRKVGKAVTRNRVKRTIREAFWELTEDLTPDHDYVVVARPGVESLVESEGTEGVRNSLHQLLSGDVADDAAEPGGEASV
jgi:ribonuclease P protein component